MEESLINKLKQKNIKIGTDTTTQSYIDTPIETFGIKILNKLGWKKGDGIGLHTSGIHLEPIEYVSRHHRLGLGAEPSTLKGSHAVLPSKYNSKNYKAIGETLKKDNLFEVGSEIQITSGKHSDMYAIIVKKFTTQDIEYAQVKLLANDVLINVKMSEISAPNNIKLAKRTHTDKYTERKEPLKWVIPNLIVRINCKHYKNGIYYQKKGIISDVISNQQFLLMTKDGIMIDDLSESQIETIPPSLLDWAAPIRGSHKGRSGRAIEINDLSGEVCLQLENCSIIRCPRMDCCLMEGLMSDD